MQGRVQYSTTNLATSQVSTINGATWVNTCPEEDLDEDGVAAWEDCDDNDSTVPTEDDADCDGIVDGCFLTPCDTSVDNNGIGADFVLIDDWKTHWDAIL